MVCHHDATAPCGSRGFSDRSGAALGGLPQWAGPGLLPEIARQGHQREAQGNGEADPPEEVKRIPDVVGPLLPAVVHLPTLAKVGPSMIGTSGIGDVDETDNHRGGATYAHHEPGVFPHHGLEAKGPGPHATLLSRPAMLLDIVHEGIVTAQEQPDHDQRESAEEHRHDGMMIGGGPTNPLGPADGITHPERHLA